MEMSWTEAGLASIEKQISIFFSYAHADEEHRNKLQNHLSFLKRSRRIQTWHDRKIMPGQSWDSEIDHHLEAADLIIFLVSADFAASDYCWDIEAKRAFERHQEGTAVLIPIMIRPVAGWEDTPLGRLQALPKDARAVTLWSNQDEAYNDIAKGLIDLIEHWPKRHRMQARHWRVGL
jgi:hypothetical protein